MFIIDDLFFTDLLVRLALISESMAWTAANLVSKVLKILDSIKPTSPWLVDNYTFGFNHL